MEKPTHLNPRRYPYWRIELVARLWTALAILCLNCPSLSRADPPPKTDLLNLSLDELSAIKIDTVYAASKFTEKVTDAPSSVTIVGRDEIERFGYRTLADIIESVRSFDIRYDRNYSYTGVRGFNSLGDYGSRVLLLVDGHRMNDPIFDTAAVGTEGFVDVDLIERVEFIRGPGSAIYGSNAFFGVINVVTRSGASVGGVELSGSGGSFGSYSGRATVGNKLANGVEYLFSATDYWSDGPTRLFFPEFNTPVTNHGIALRQDGDRYWSFLGKISYGDFTLEGGYVTREKDVPTGSFGSIFNLPNTTVDSHGYIELRYAHQIEDGWSLAGRAYYDFVDYHELASYDYGNGIPVVNDDSARVHWWGLEVSASRDLFEHFHFVLGTDFRQTLDLSQRNYDEHPFASYLDVGGYQLVFGTYADGRWDITKSLSLSAGLRWDFYDSFGNTVNPRAALIWKPRDGTTLKLLYGEAFRAPNVYQLYYSSVDQRANPSLQPETIRTYEAVFDQYLAQHWHGSISLFRNEISGLIDTTTDSSGFIMFTNASDASVNGAEFEIEGKWDNGVLTRASYTRQDAFNTKTGRQLVNSPKNVFKSQISVPVWPDKVFASVELLYASDRQTLLHHRTGEAWLLNTTLYTRKLLPGLEVSASIYNLLDQRYGTPGGPEHVQDVLIQDGRTFRIKFTYRF